jgi:hypothetical protein
MGRLIALSALRESVRVRYDLPTFTTTSFVKLVEVDSLINASLTAFYAMLQEAYGDGYFATSGAIAITPGAATSPLPTDSVKLLGLWWVRGPDDVVKIEQGTIDDLRLGSYTPRPWSQGWGPLYRLSGNTVQWLPPPSAAATVRADYVRLPPELVADTDTFDAGIGWQEWVINDVAGKIADKEEKDPAVWLTKRADWEARIRAQAPERDEGGILQLRDVSCYEDGESAWARRNRLTLGRW